ncbi:tetraspanin-18-like [Gigantopelta aegis]|uniref:tetraspanin-18-like n=1 Tax=Gigantopelta aegis TaxID=1735272 RepID=UPI001B889BBD|nr:tetraspanin-18-like [Gigantopelta aegis]XP_041373149.1 tetraspanin-18-like [Gigantopelta aegis]
MGVFQGCSRLVLVAVNMLFTLIGLALLVVGCIVRFGANVLDPYLNDLLSALSELMKKAGTDLDLANFDLGEYLSNASLAVIIIGTFFFVVGILGCCGACCKLRPFLVVYAVILILIVLAEVLFVILLFVIRDKIKDVLKQPMLDSIREDFTGFNGTDVITLGWNFAMISFKCCGVDNYTDFWNASRWIRTYNDPTLNFTQTLEAPIACCKLNGTFPNVEAPANFTCAVHPNPEISNIDKGCFQAFEDFLTGNSNVMIGVGAGVVLIELLMIIFAFCVCHQNNKKVDDYD